ncbi:MAG: sarcosine oxidase, subunit beta [Mycobacterium sp.]|nr:sarcosine oxidase, subunit beta [Mycobacterium sp.]
MTAAVVLFPIFARAHLLLTWGGIVDDSPDASPIIRRTPYRNLYLDCGWDTGAFKATPASAGAWPTPSPATNRTLIGSVQPGPLRHRGAGRRTRRRRGRALNRLRVPAPEWCWSTSSPRPAVLCSRHRPHRRRRRDRVGPGRGRRWRPSRRCDTYSAPTRSAITTTGSCLPWSGAPTTWAPPPRPSCRVTGCGGSRPPRARRNRHP